MFSMLSTRISGRQADVANDESFACGALPLCPHLPGAAASSRWQQCSANFIEGTRIDSLPVLLIALLAAVLNLAVGPIKDFLVYDGKVCSSQTNGSANGFQSQNANCSMTIAKYYYDKAPNAAFADVVKE